MITISPTQPTMVPITIFFDILSVKVYKLYVPFKFVYYVSHENKMNYYSMYIYVTVVSVGTIGNRLLSM